MYGSSGGRKDLSQNAVQLYDVVSLAETIIN